jgi:crotonobetainyl-CoA:carnitine CoA-transferase CaiB-like acyl-CoA transferase
VNREESVRMNQISNSVHRLSETDSDSSAALPLAGIRVLELGSFITAPLAAMMLADLGAEVIKIERPDGGDPFRAFKGGLYSPYFRGNNRSKRSVTLDFGKPAGRAILERMVPNADVILENFRPGFMNEIGLSYERLKTLNPKIVYCAITGFGPTGPYCSRPSYDTVGQALSGLLSMHVPADNPRITGLPYSDSVTGQYAAYGILGALLQRARTGKGVLVEVNMLAATMSFLEMFFIDSWASGEVPTPYRKSEVNTSFALPCSDGKLIAIHISSPEKFWRGLVAATESPQLGTDERFASRVGRIANYEALRHELNTIFQRHPRSYWLGRLEEHDVPFAPVWDLAEVPMDPQVMHLGVVRDVQHATEGATRMLSRPVWYDGNNGADAISAAPTLGEHTEEILSGLGCSEDAIAQLRTDAII